MKTMENLVQKKKGKEGISVSVANCTWWYVVQLMEQLSMSEERRFIPS